METWIDPILISANSNFSFSGQRVPCVSDGNEGDARGDCVRRCTDID